jgi:hypothetical protein
MSAKKQNFQILAHCPTTGEQVLGERVLHFFIQGRKGVWWCCPSCQGWHVLVYEADKEAIEEYSPNSKQLRMTTV